MNNPIFILGNPRSGTSLLRSLINSHKNVVIPPECGFMHFLYNKYKNFELDQLDLFLEDLFLCKKFEGWFMNKKELKVFLLKNKPKNYNTLIYFVYKFYGQKSKKDVLFWGDKNNYYINHLNDLNEIFPNSKYIHLIRNPKDVLVSYLKVNELDQSKYKPKFSNNNLEIINSWIDNNNNITMFLNEKKVNHIVINYETLLTETKFVVDEIFNFIGISSDSVIENFNNNLYFDEPKITMGWKSKLTNPIDSNNKSKFNEFLSISEITEIDDLLKSKTLHFNYIKDN